MNTNTNEFTSNKIHNLSFLLLFLLIFENILEIAGGFGSESLLYRVIYLFLIPAIFFLSGYSAEYQRGKILSEFIYPYIIFQILYLLADCFWINPSAENGFLLQFTTPKGNMWLLLSVSIAYLCIPLLDAKSNLGKLLFFLASLCGSLLIGYDSQIGNTLAISRFFNFLPFFVGGYYIGKKQVGHGVFSKIKEKTGTKLFFVCGIILSIFYIAASSEVSANVLYGNYAYTVFGYTVFTRMMLILLAALWIGFLMLVLPVPQKKIPWCSRVGKNIWPVYLLHGFFVQALAKYNCIAKEAGINFVLTILLTIALLVVLGNFVVYQVYDKLFTGEWIVIIRKTGIFTRLKNGIQNWCRKKMVSKRKPLTKVQKILYGVTFFLFLLDFVIFSVSSYIIDNFSNLSFEELVFHMKVPMKGTGNSMVTGFFTYAKDALVIFFLCYVGILVLFFYGKSIRSLKKVRIGSLLLAIVCFVVSLFRIGQCLQVNTYLSDQSTYSTFVEDNYVEPKNTKLEFPKKKRNLIYIYMESMETTFLSKKDGGAMKKNLIPELTDLAKNNINFSANNKVGGATATTGGTWTIGAMVSQSTGLPLLIPIDSNSYGEYSSFLPGATSLGDILKKNGYAQEIMVGSDMAFAGRDLFYKQHGDFQVWDYHTAIQKGKINASYYEWWGYEDKKLYEYAKEEISRLAKGDKPFHFTMLTADTHHIGGYVCDLCEDKSESQYENVLACASRQVAAFIKWIQKQDFYENTTVVVVGDHPTMDESYMENHYDKSVPRKVYNCYINAVGDDTHAKNRDFTTLDLFPTTLSAMGIKIEGEKLALGTNLFSGEETLVETYGYDKVKKELKHTSKFYNEKILGE